jgi:hypothetical protein
LSKSSLRAASCSGEWRCLGFFCWWALAGWVVEAAGDEEELGGWWTVAQSSRTALAMGCVVAGETRKKAGVRRLEMRNDRNA